MAINTIGFLILFIVILILYYSVSQSLRILLLTMANVFFYAMFGMSGLIILSAIVFFTWGGAGLIYRYMGNPTIAKSILGVETIIVIGWLIAIRLLPSGNIYAPIGISFFSLQALGYVIDVYKHKASPEKNLLRYFLFISFFPTVTSGPIQRSDVFLRKLREEVDFSYDKVRHGLLMMGYGLFAKNFVADRLGYIVDHAFDGYNTEPGFILLIGVVLYAFQLYCDFMGYSYIALGAAKALGFDLPDNFRRPYFSTSVKEFWSRWHISLSEWFRDYLYFPLGGSRKGIVRTLINIAIVFIVSGIWHGRGMTFLIWGLLHGFYRIIEELTLKKRNLYLSTVKNPLLHKMLNALFALITFIAVDFAWLFFRAESVESAIIIIRRILLNSDIIRCFEEGLLSFGLSKKELLVWMVGLAVIIIVDCLRESQISVYEWLGRRKAILRWSVNLLFVIFMICEEIYYYGYSASTFIYSGF